MEFRILKTIPVFCSILYPIDEKYKKLFNSTQRGLLSFVRFEPVSYVIENSNVTGCLFEGIITLDEIPKEIANEIIAEFRKPDNMIRF